jgi:hypothetical protein
VCYSVEKLQWPADTQAGLPVCCGQALKSVGERNTHGGTGGAVAGTCFGGNRPRERSSASGWREVALLDIEGGDLAAGVTPCWRNVDRKYRLGLRVAAMLCILKAPRAPAARTYTSI